VKQQQFELGHLARVTGPNGKRCTSCHEVKLLSAFYADRLYADNHHHQCKRCRSVISAFTHSEYPTRLRQRFYTAQNGICPVCAQLLDLTEPNTLDHPHSADAMENVHTYAAAITGLLHRNCNVGLGMLNDDPIVLRRAARYIERTRKYGQQQLDL